MIHQRDGYCWEEFLPWRDEPPATLLRGPRKSPSSLSLGLNSPSPPDPLFNSHTCAEAQTGPPLGHTSLLTHLRFVSRSASDAGCPAGAGGPLNSAPQHRLCLPSPTTASRGGWPTEPRRERCHTATFQQFSFFNLFVSWPLLTLLRALSRRPPCRSLPTPGSTNRRINRGVTLGPDLVSDGDVPSVLEGQAVAFV